MRTWIPGLASLLLAISSAWAEPALWKASDEDSEIYLFGSIHLLNEGAEWQTDTLESALSVADYYYYEVPVEGGAEAEMQQLAMQYGLNTDGRTLSSFLEPDEQARMAEAAASLGLDAAGLQSLKPWLAYLTLTVVAVQQAGYSPDSGVDLTMLKKTEDSKERFFETPEQQIRFFADMPEELQTNLLMTAVDEIEEGPVILNQMTTAWRAGDVETLDAIINENMRDVSPEVYDTLIIKRNKLWVEEILTLMDGDEEAVIIVGAGHMVGENGVPNLLEQAGVTVERVQ